MERRAAIIGFGEAGRAFVPAAVPGFALTAYDLKREAAMREAADAAGVTLADCAADALGGAEAVLSLVTADQALFAAQVYAPHLAPGALWFDMNSVAPHTKRDAANAVADTGGRYVDVAVMSPAYPSRLDVPLLLSGPDAGHGIALLRALGFTHLRRIEGDIGAASAIKMIRSVMVKGTEALTAECMLAAEAAGVRDEVLASLDASAGLKPWAERADYNLDRMLVHGSRRAAEMEEVVRTLDALGTGSVMSRATVERQRALGSLGLAPPKGLDAKLAALAASKQEIVA